MKGFFSKKEITGRKDACELCGLDRECISPRMKVSGHGLQHALIIAEAPGKTEDEQGTQLVGKAGDLLREHLFNLGLDLDADFWKTNAVNCRPPENRKPLRKEIKYCRARVMGAVKKYKPRFILLLGGAAVESFYLDSFKDLTITRWRKRCIPDKETGAWVIPLFHPSFVVRKQDEKLDAVFKADLKWMKSCLNRSAPDFYDYSQDCFVLEEQEAIELLNKIHKGMYAIDYETNGLNPWRVENPEVFCASLSNGESSFSFRMTPKIAPFWIEFLKNPNIGKIAHHLKFEEKWSRVVFGTPVQGWEWCTMTTEHILDNRRKVTGLKYQAYVRYGVKGYDKDVKIYIKGLTGGISPEAARKVMQYNAMDSRLTYQLFLDQKNELRRRKNIIAGDDLFFEGNLALADVEANGVPTDPAYYLKQHKALTRRIDYSEEKLLNDEVALTFKKKVGRQIDLGSPADLRKLLYDVLRLPKSKFTTNQNESVDQEVLEDADLPFCKNLVAHRKLLKTRDTYLAQFARETCPDVKLHPSFNLNLVATYRGSSDSPNFQNIPVRDEESKRITRSGIIPGSGNKIMEVDYGSLEVRIMACYTHDPVLIDYLLTGGDMHKDEAIQTFKFSEKEWYALDKKVAKDARFFTKNQKVFPYFYGSYHRTCAGYLWKTIQQIGLVQHLNSKGIRKYEDFESWLKEDERRFWGKFKVFREWQKGVEREYIQNGKIVYFTGFEVEGYLSRNELLNYRIQGSAFHCLLWSLIQLNKEIKERKLLTRIIGQIHDSIVFDLFPPEQEEIIALCNSIMTERIRKEWPWIIVPLVAEFEITEIDQAWYFKKEIKI